MIHEKLRTLLCCPVTRQSLKPAPETILNKLNTGIRKGKVKNKEGHVITEVFSEGLITEDSKILYPIRSGVPVLLESESVILADIRD